MNAKNILLSAFVCCTATVLQITVVHAEIPITQEQNIFAIIRAVDGDHISMEAVHSVASRDGSSIIGVTSKLGGTVARQIPAANRVAVCVDTIGNPGTVTLTPYGKQFPHDGCFGQLHDYEGSAGLDLGDLKVGTPVRVMLNGDLTVLHP
ncbi:MAG: hypothetical protein HQL35_09150 [Alphaproteobacteria bacterium]|nr:hypothetical protein [Alphaproteobacteria bacterium]